MRSILWACRQDARDRVSGEAVYTRDMRLPGMLYAKILTSPYAHARIADMDTSEGGSFAGCAGHTPVR